MPLFVAHAGVGVSSANVFGVSPLPALFLFAILVVVTGVTDPGGRDQPKGASTAQYRRGCLLRQRAARAPALLTLRCLVTCDGSDNPTNHSKSSFAMIRNEKRHYSAKWLRRSADLAATQRLALDISRLGAGGWILGQGRGNHCGQRLLRTSANDLVLRFQIVAHPFWRTFDYLQDRSRERVVHRGCNV